MWPGATHIVRERLPAKHGQRTTHERLGEDEYRNPGRRRQARQVRGARRHGSHRRMLANGRIVDASRGYLQAPDQPHAQHHHGCRPGNGGRHAEQPKSGTGNDRTQQRPRVFGHRGDDVRRRQLARRAGQPRQHARLDRAVRASQPRSNDPGTDDHDDRCADDGPAGRHTKEDCSGANRHSQHAVGREPVRRTDDRRRDHHRRKRAGDAVQGNERRAALVVRVDEQCDGSCELAGQRREPAGFDAAAVRHAEDVSDRSHQPEVTSARPSCDARYRPCR